MMHHKVIVSVQRIYVNRIDVHALPPLNSERRNSGRPFYQQCSDVT